MANRYMNNMNATKSATKNDDDGCDDPEEITDYFFKVYGESEKVSSRVYIPEENLNEMIKHQLVGFPKSRLIQYRTDKNICPRKTCFNYQSISNMIDNDLLDRNEFLKICPVLLFNGEMNGCIFPEDQGQLAEWEKWFYGMLFSGIVTIWSWGGAIVFPIIQKKVYKQMLTFMISLAFGCLTCNSLLKYVPLADGFDSTNLENTNRSYFLKHLVVLAVLFFFFNFERFMKIFAIYRTQKFKEKRRLQNASYPSFSNQLSSSSTGEDERPQFSLGTVDDEYNRNDPEKQANNNEASRKLSRRASRVEQIMNKDNSKKKMRKRMSMDLGHVNLVGIQSIDQVTDQFAEIMKQKEEDDEEENNEMPLSKSGRICCTSLSEGISEVRPIGWMAIFGDGLGNFIDGLSIGASISQNIVLGLTTGFATWCGNIPQELGDFALLVRSGMTPFQALFYNWLSANSCYLGCAIGIIFGSDLESARWIFAISGGTSLYLGLAVLLPEMKEEFDNHKGPISEKLTITYIQLLGMVTGITTIAILNMYEDDFVIG